MALYEEYFFYLAYGRLKRFPFLRINNIEEVKKCTWNTVFSYNNR